MAETSGFFQAMLDETTGKYDRVYLAREFANYFALFVKNGVFGSPTNQLRVSPGNGLSISVAPGNAFIKGMWYNNSSMKNIVIVPNYTSSNRVDTVRVRMSDLTRTITAEVFTGDADLVRGEDVFDLQIATVTVKPGAESITAADIADTRPNENVCGFVTQLLRAETTNDLFAQFQAQFDQWFATVQESLSGDVAGNLQNQIDAIETDVGELQTSNVALTQNLFVGLRRIVLFETTSGMGQTQPISGDFKEAVPKVAYLPNDSGVGYRTMTMSFVVVQYFPTQYTNVTGTKVAVGIPSDGGSGCTIPCTCTVPKPYQTSAGEGSESDATLRTYVRKVVITPSNSNEKGGTFEIKDCHKVVLSDLTYPTLAEGPVNNDMNRIYKIFGIGWFGKTNYNISVR